MIVRENINEKLKHLRGLSNSDVDRIWKNFEKLKGAELGEALAEYLNSFDYYAIQPEKALKEVLSYTPENTTINLQNLLKEFDLLDRTNFITGQLKSLGVIYNQIPLEIQREMLDDYRRELV